MLTINKKLGTFVLQSNDEAKAKSVGLTLSSKIRSRTGEKVWFTADHEGNPTLNHYAALPFYDEADAKTKKILSSLHADFVNSRAKESDKDYPRPNGKEFRPFQRAGISYALDKGNVLIGDEPGLGKTIQAIGVANALEAERVLVICPATIRLNWQREILDWSMLPRCSTYPILRGVDGVNPYSNYTIVSYNLAGAKGINEALEAIKWDLIVIDESHFLKTEYAKRTQTILGGTTETGLIERADRVLALTGTPLPNRPRECFTIARALCYEAIDWMSYDDFSYRFNPAGYVGNMHIVEARGRLPELQARLRCNFMIRRLKKDVLDDLPEKTYEFTYIEPNGAIKKALAKEALIDFKVEDLTDPFAEIWGEIATVRREMGEAKIPRIIEHMKYLLDIVEIPKVVIFAHHKSVMDGIKQGLAKYGLVEVRGGVSPKNKQKAVDDFVNDPKIRVWQGQLDAAGFGIDGLQKVCSHAVLAEPAWTEGTNEQCVGRLDRMLQKFSVLAQFLIVEGSFDERVLGTVLNKAYATHEVLDK